MMRFKFHISLICMVFAVLPVQAKIVEAGKAEKVAQNYMQSKRKHSAKTNVRLKYTATNLPQRIEILKR